MSIYRNREGAAIYTRPIEEKTSLGLRLDEQENEATFPPVQGVAAGKMLPHQQHKNQRKKVQSATQ